MALEGVDPVLVDDECTFEGRTWPCGRGPEPRFAPGCAPAPCMRRPGEAGVGVHHHRLPHRQYRPFGMACRQWLGARRRGWGLCGGCGAGKKREEGIFGPPPVRVDAMPSPGTPEPLDLQGVDPAPADIPEPAAPPTANGIPTRAAGRYTASHAVAPTAIRLPFVFEGIKHRTRGQDGPTQRHSRAARLSGLASISSVPRTV